MNTATALDRLAARWGQKLIDRAAETLHGEKEDIADTIENLVRAAASVFEHHGMTAGFLFLLSRTKATESSIARIIADELVKLICELDSSLKRPEKTEPQPLLEFLDSQVTVQLPRLLQIHRVIGDTLTFARLTATAMRSSKEEPVRDAGE